MIGDNIGPLIWRGIIARVRSLAADYWFVAIAVGALIIGMFST